FLERRCPAAGETFRPPPWCFEGRLQTVLGALLGARPPVSYCRWDPGTGTGPVPPATPPTRSSARSEAIRTPDGGRLILDWAKDADGHRHPEPHARPTVLLLPGLTGSSQAGYLLRLVHRASRAGYRAGTPRHGRATAGAPALLPPQTPRTFCASNTEDLETAIAHIRRRYPRAPLLAVGVSLGGIQVLNYLGRRGHAAGLAAAMALSPSWDLNASATSLEQRLNAVLFNRRLATALCQLVSRWAGGSHTLQGGPTPGRGLTLSLARTIQEFDERYTAPSFGYRNCREYYQAASPARQLHRVRVPVLCLNAADDPFSPLHAIPVAAAWHLPHVALLVTAHGGHVGFLEGLWPPLGSYMERLFAQFIAAVFEHGEELQQL
ncbi:ABHD1 protein, partial [Trogon melanurus]|nr:ABHD1 protein [Trogon melanurus]